MQAILNAVTEVGTYLYQVGESVVVGTTNTAIIFGEGTVAVLKAIFTGAGIGS